MSQLHICGDKDALVSYLYEEVDPIERQRVAEHLAGCQACRTELEELTSVRQALAGWTPPARALAFRLVQAGEAEEVTRRSWWHVPAWAQVAAAVLVMGVAAAVAHVEVRFGSGGVTIRTGWQQAAAPAQPAAAADPVRGAQPWAADLAALERRLHAQGEAGRVVTAGQPAAEAGRAAPVTQDQVRAIVRAALADSEQRQQRELALRVAQVQRDFEGQRRADLVRIEESFGQLGGWTGAEVSRQRDMLNYLLRVNSQPIK